jgi:transposase-like protein
VRWYLRFKLNFRDLVEIMAERNLSMAHTIVMRWVHHYVLELECRWNRFARPVWTSWRVDETYVKIRGATPSQRVTVNHCAGSLVQVD